MYSRVLAFVVALMLLASGMMASASAYAGPDQHPLSVLAAVEQSPGELPVTGSAGHDQIEPLLDVPDQLAGPCAPRDASLLACRMDRLRAASPTHPHLKGPQRPPRVSARPA